MCIFKSLLFNKDQYLILHLFWQIVFFPYVLKVCVEETVIACAWDLNSKVCLKANFTFNFYSKSRQKVNKNKSCVQ